MNTLTCSINAACSKRNYNEEHGSVNIDISNLYSFTRKVPSTELDLENLLKVIDRTMINEKLDCIELKLELDEFSNKCISLDLIENYIYSESIPEKWNISSTHCYI